MPEFGLKTKEQIGEASTADLSAFPPLPWRLPMAEVVQVTFEVDLGAALELLPEQLSRPVPPSGRILVPPSPESPVGPSSEALLLLAPRSAMLPKNYVVAAVVPSEAVRAAYAGIWSLPVTAGTIELRRQRTAEGGEDI